VKLHPKKWQTKGVKPQSLKSPDKIKPLNT